MFKKRKNATGVLGGYNPSKVPYCRSSEDGSRNLVRVSPDEYRQFNPIDFVDFSLTEELQAGVNIKELPTANLLNPSPEMNDEQILEALESQQQQENNE